jgi:hypothetical protein
MAAFSNGNLARVTHGVYSDRRVNPVARELVSAALDARPDLEDHPAAVWSWARIESKCLLLEAWLDEFEFIDEDGKPTAPAQLVTRYEKLALNLRARLGLDPLSQAQLQNTRAQATLVSFDIEELRARGREVMALRANG